MNYPAIFETDEACCDRSQSSVSTKSDDRRTVRTALIRFPSLYHELGLSTHAHESLSIKIEPEPNMEFLSNALAQTHWQEPKISAANWPRLVSERLQKIDWKKAVDDVRPFIEKTTDLVLLTRENVLNLLSARGRKKYNSERVGDGARARQPGHQRKPRRKINA